MPYHLIMLVLILAGATGAVIYSLKIARSPVRRIGVVRVLPGPRPAVRKGVPLPRQDRELQESPGRPMQKLHFAEFYAQAPSHSVPEIARAFGGSKIGKYKVYYSYPLGEVPEPGKTAELQSKIENLEERLKKLESESLRKSQERPDEGSEEKASYIQ